MSAGYRAVQWSPGKRVYDLTLGTLLALFLATFLGVTFVARPEITIETALIRAFGSAALLLLHVVLAIGPLARLDRRLLPLLWNRRHLGVTMFACALAHGAFALVQFHALGDRNPLVSLLSSNGRFESLAQFPFQPLGAFALAILFLMAATSHDFWLAQLTAPVWKALHLSVYLAYGLIVAHVTLGALQDERAPLLALLLAAGMVALVALHLSAARRERTIDRELRAAGVDGWVEVGRVGEIAEKRAKIVALAGERVAIFRYDGKISALSNVCQHQNGPLGEGKIVDGCITCPWHGYQYRPEDGASPAPFTERVPTFRVRVVDDRILVDPRPLAPGTRVEPASFDINLGAREDRDAFFVGYLPFPERLRRLHRGVVAALALLFVTVAAAIGVSQQPLGAGEYEYGVESELAGLLRVDPLPSIWIASTGDGVSSAGDAAPITVIPLVGPGKHGAAPEILAFAGHSVRATGSWIRRGPERLFEIARVEIVPAMSPQTSAAAVELERLPLGATTLRGEIVDSKCWLGVMKPGEGKSHKACAIRCLSGGSPAAFVVRSEKGAVAVLWLVAPSGRPLGRELLDVTGEPVEIAGELVRVGGRSLLVAERSSVRRLD